MVSIIDKVLVKKVVYVTKVTNIKLYESSLQLTIRFSTVKVCILLHCKYLYILDKNKLFHIQTTIQ